MAMVVKNNMSAVSTLNTLNKNSSALQKSLQKVSSGMKINSAQDDASGYAISERMRVQIRSLDQANQNTQNSASMMKTAEGAVSSTVEILKSLKEKAINAANDTNTDSDRVTIQKELDQFIDQIDDNALTTFNGKFLVDGSKSQRGQATYTAMTNQSLATDTTGSTQLTALKNRNNESLEIESTDWVTASFVSNGKTYTTKYSVESTTLDDVFKNLNDTFKTATNGAENAFYAADGSESVTEVKPSTGTTTTSATSGSTGATTGTSGSTGATTGTVKTAAEIQAMSEADLLAAAKGGANADLAATKADTTGTAATDLATAVTNAVNALSTGIATNSGNAAAPALGLTYTDASGANQTIAANAQTAAQIGDTLAGEAKTAIEGAIAGASSKSDLKNAAKAVLDSAKTNTTNTAIAYTDSEVDALVDAVLNDAALNNATNSSGGTTGGTSGSEASTGTTVTNSTGGKGIVNSVSYKTGSNVNDNPLTIMNTNGATNIVGTNSAGDTVTTADGTSGLTVTAATSGIKGQISGITISISDSEGNVKKSANASLDNFKTTIYAQNKSASNELSFQVGASANQAIAVGLSDMRSEALGLKGSDGSKVSIATQDKANAAVAVFDNAIQKALDQQTTIGAVEARLDYTSQNLTTSSENVQAAESTIRDSDMAKEMTNYTKNNVLLQAAQSMLAQANQSSSAVLSLLQ